MIRFAKIIEFDDHQFLIRACSQPFLAGLPHSAGQIGFSNLLTIDTETDTGIGNHPMRMIINCKRPDILKRCFYAFNEVHCYEALPLLLKEKSGKLTRQEMVDAVQRFQDSLLEQVG